MGGLLFAALIFCLVAWGAHWIITHYFPEPMQMVALAIVGIFLLIVLLGMVSGYIPGEWLRLPGGVVRL